MWHAWASLLCDLTANGWRSSLPTVQPHESILVFAVMLGATTACGSSEDDATGSGGPSASHCVPIPAGTFMMGSDNGYNSEKPAHSVTVAAFCMDRTEVTVAAYAACVKAGKCTAAEAGSDDNYCNAGVAGRENHPINCVDWNQAVRYCEAQGQRLPTEEEWEYAARGTDGREYPWGNEEPSNQLCWNGEGNDLGYANGYGNRRSTCPVGTYPKGRSPFGLEDMSGNVWEWTSSPWTDDFASPPVGSIRVNRGGSWDSGDPSHVRSASRGRDVPSVQYRHLGFRCAGSVSAAP